jgi:pimeloyl-ACP methyl ester carboxylesterase
VISISSGNRLLPLVAVLLLSAVLAGCATTSQADEDSSRTVTYIAADGVTVHADIYMATADDKAAPLILLFHQAGGDSQGEYGPIMPRLLAAGYNIIGVDQRVGGTRFGGTNRTVDGLATEAEGYCSAYPDLEVTLNYAIEQGFSGPRAAWGSSYSAALVLRLAAEHPSRLNAVLSFSPASGAPLADCHPDDFAPLIKIPALLLRPEAEVTAKTSREQFQRFADAGLETHVAQPGTHGSSMLVEARVEGGEGVEETWKVVLDFLDTSLNTKSASAQDRP